MNCQRFRLDMLKYLQYEKQMPVDMKKHLEKCKECRGYFQQCSDTLGSFINEEESSKSDFTGVEVFISSIMPDLNRKSIFLQEKRKQRMENILFAAMIFGFTGIAAFILYSYIFAGNVVPLYAAVGYIFLSSLVTVLIVPFARKEI